MTVTKESETKDGFCQCGRPLHYSNQSIKNQVNRMIDLAKDQFVTVTLIEGGPSYRVQRHYIALHGLSAAKLEEYGFERVEPERNGNVGG